MVIALVGAALKRLEDFSRIQEVEQVDLT